MADIGRLHARGVVKACIKAADPGVMVRNALGKRGKVLGVGGRRIDLDAFERVMVIGGGKASALMASAVGGVLGERVTAGNVIVPEYQRELPRLRRIRFLRSTHPLPSHRGVDAVARMLRSVEGLTERDLVLCLVSGGGSALMTFPAEGVALEDMQKVTELMLESGAKIQEINCVRKHLSDIKGGRLAERLMPATVVALIISDVVGDDLASVASGPTVPDGSTFAEARAILADRKIWAKSPVSVRRVIEAGAAGRIPETPKPVSGVFGRVHNVLVGSNVLARQAAARELRRLGYSVTVIEDVQGEARGFGAELAGLAMRKRPGTAVVAGGETTVTVKGRGRGGRNQEVALAAAITLAGSRGITVASFSTDGVDGPTDAAGALADGETVERGEKLGMAPEEHLENNDSYTFFRALRDLIITGPTGTNVNDVSVAMIHDVRTGGRSR